MTFMQVAQDIFGAECKRLESTVADGTFFIPQVHAWNEADDAELMMCLATASGSPATEDGVNARDAALLAADLIGRATECDYLAVVLDAHQTTTETNPDTGERWGPGEMQEYADTHGAGDVLIEQLAMFAVRRSDKKAAHMLRRYRREGASTRWLGDTEFRAEWDDDSPEASGLVVEALRRAVGTTVIDMAAKELGRSREAILEHFGFSEEERILHQMLAASKFLLGRAEKDPRYGFLPAMHVRPELKHIADHSLEGYEVELFGPEGVVIGERDETP